MAFSTGAIADTVHTVYFNQLYSGRYLTMQRMAADSALGVIEIEIIVAIYNFNSKCQGELGPN